MLPSDLGTGRTRIVARLPVPLGHAMATTVGSRILLVGGRVTANRQTDAMWWFDPATAGFTRAGRLPAPLSDAAVAAHGHRIWLLGGEDPAVTEVDTDVLVLGEGEDREACELVQDLAGVIPGVRGIYGGRLRNAHQVEALTANLISVNRRYKAHAGIRVTDL